MTAARRHAIRRLHRKVSIIKISPRLIALTSTFFALQILQARFCTLPSAKTTSGANSIPNLLLCFVSNSLNPQEEEKTLTFDE
jgi:hypothetical protein